MLLVGGLVGAIGFAALTGFGRTVRSDISLAAEVDRWLVSAGFGINEISLSGHRQTLDHDIFRALGAQGATLVRLDIGAARRRLEALPWVEQAAVIRILPDKLRVEIRERTPAAIWRDGERAHLVDGRGRVLALAGSVTPPGLVVISGKGAPAAVADLLAALAHVRDLEGQVQIARRIGERRWDVDLADGTVARLPAGATREGLERLARFERARAGGERRTGGIIDLTVPGRIILTQPRARVQAAAGDDRRPAPPRLLPGGPG